jgi:hypothetical protein
MGNIQDVFGGHEFDANAVEPSVPFEALPAGWYDAFIEEAEVKATKKNDGYYIKLTFRILTPGFENRKVFENINLRNPSPEAEKIGLAQLSSLGRSIGVMNIKDTSDLLNKAVQIKLSVKQDEAYGAKNEVKGFKALESAGQPAAPGAAPAAAAAAPGAAPAAPAGGYVPPWKKK